MLGISPRVDVSVPSFHLLPSLVAGTRQVALARQRLVDRTPTPGVRASPCPFPAVPRQEAMWWHPAHTQDAGHIWLRRIVEEVGEAVDNA